MFNSKEYCRKNSEKAKARAKKWYEDNKEYRLAQDKKKRSTPEYKETMKEYLRQYYIKNREVLRKKHNEYKINTDYLKWKRENHKLNMETNPNYRFGHILRGRINSALRFNRTIKAKKTEELLGCSVEVARKHIESQFKPGMTWDNHGRRTWHIDHIKPISSFDLSNPEEQKKAFHYTNLQPLHWVENLTKGSKIDDDIVRTYGRP